nr:MAG TPA: hypothetical protein [Caudoviricetes sp.]
MLAVIIFSYPVLLVYINLSNRRLFNKFIYAILLLLTCIAYNTTTPN